MLSLLVASTPRGIVRVIWLSGVACALAAMARAEPEQELRQAVTALARTSYSWETTVRQRFKGATTQPRLDPKAPLEVQGQHDPEHYTSLTLLPSRDLPVAITAISRYGDVVVQTTEGWVRRADVRPAARTERDVTFAGKPVRASRVVSSALKVAALRPLTEDLLDLLPELKNHRTAEGLILADLRDEHIEQLWGDSQARRAPDLHGTVIFKLGDTGISEVHFVLGIGFPDPRTQAVTWNLQQWSTRIRSIGTTTVTPPAEATAVLEQ